MALPLTLMFLITSCATQEVCNDDNQSYLVAKFKTLWNDGSIHDTIVAGLSIYGIREGKADSLLYDSLSVSRLELPLDPNNGVSRFVIGNELKKDTLSLFAPSEVYLINYTCGFASRFTLEQYSSEGSWIKDLELRDAKIDAELETDEEHLWIYL